MTKFIDHESYGKKTACICPKCRRKHTVKMRWIGRGIVWKFCQPCKRECDDYECIDDCSRPSVLYGTNYPAMS